MSLSVALSVLLLICINFSYNIFKENLTDQKLFFLIKI